MNICGILQFILFASGIQVLVHLRNRRIFLIH